MSPLALAACGEGGGSSVASGPVVSTPTPTPVPAPSPSPTSVERNIDPRLTSAAITTNFASYFVVNPDPTVAAKGRLFVMLPGTGATPSLYRDVVRTGAARGYHALGLTYPNDNAIELLCLGSVDPDCDGKARREVILGEDRSTLVAVNPVNAIVGRLRSLLTYLAAAYPTEGWGQFLVAGEPNWSLITVAGHSQGGGHAAYLAKLQNLDRTVMFSSPGDTGVGGGSAAWFSLPNVTPASRQYGFTHLQDNLIPYALMTANWRAIGIDAFGPAISVDGMAAPFANSRQLTTDAAPNPSATGPTAYPFHNATVGDAATPRTSGGDPLYRAVWIYLAFP